MLDLVLGIILFINGLLMIYITFVFMTTRGRKFKFVAFLLLAFTADFLIGGIHYATISAYWPWR